MINIKTVMASLLKILKKEFFPISLVLILTLSRLIPHPYNFTPVLAVGIFSGFYFKQIYLSLFVVIFSMFIADIFLGFHSTMFFTYISLAIAVLIGLYVKRFKFIEILFSGIASSICFFIITNFGAWLTLDLYDKNLAGLLNSYVLAIPFFHNTLLSTFLYLTILKLLFDLGKKNKIFKAAI